MLLQSHDHLISCILLNFAENYLFIACPLIWSDLIVFLRQFQIRITFHYEHALPWRGIHYHGLLLLGWFPHSKCFYPVCDLHDLLFVVWINSFKRLVFLADQFNRRDNSRFSSYFYAQIIGCHLIIICTISILLTPQIELISLVERLENDNSWGSDWDPINV